jgi:hypothetical protein
VALLDSGVLGGWAGGGVALLDGGVLGGGAPLFRCLLSQKLSCDGRL